MKTGAFPTSIFLIISPAIRLRKDMLSISIDLDHLSFTERIGSSP